MAAVACRIAAKEARQLEMCRTMMTDVLPWWTSTGLSAHEAKWKCGSPCAEAVSRNRSAALPPLGTPRGTRPWGSRAGPVIEKAEAKADVAAKAAPKRTMPRASFLSSLGAKQR